MGSFYTTKVSKVVEIVLLGPADLLNLILGERLVGEDEPCCIRRAVGRPPGSQRRGCLSNLGSAAYVSSPEGYTSRARLVCLSLLDLRFESQDSRSRAYVPHNEGFLGLPDLDPQAVVLLDLVGLEHAGTGLTKPSHVVHALCNPKEPQMDPVDCRFLRIQIGPPRVTQGVAGGSRGSKAPTLGLKELEP